MNGSFRNSQDTFVDIFLVELMSFTLDGILKVDEMVCKILIHVRSIDNGSGRDLHATLETACCPRKPITGVLKTSVVYEH